MLKDLAGLVELYRGTDTQVLFYLTPLDVQSGAELLGEPFRAVVEQNAALVQRALAAQGAGVLDLHAALPPECFFWRKEGGATEHLNSEGRQRVADRITGAIRE